MRPRLDANVKVNVADPFLSPLAREREEEAIQRLLLVLVEKDI